MSQLETQTAAETTLTVTNTQYLLINHTKRATDTTDTNIKVSSDDTFTTHLITHIHSSTSSWATLEALMLDPAYRDDELCPASDLIAALEATVEVFVAAKDELAACWEKAEGIRLKKSPKQLHLMWKQYELHLKPKVDAAKGEAETTLSKMELRKWILAFMGAKDDVREDLEKWRLAYGNR